MLPLSVKASVCSACKSAKFNCRDSDYRNVASDPEFNVVNVTAHVEQVYGVSKIDITRPPVYDILMQITAVPIVTKPYSNTTIIYVF